MNRVGFDLDVMKKHRFLFAVDPSLTCSGWALFSISDGRVAAVGKIRGDAPSIALAERLERLQGRVRKILTELELAQQDVLVCESPTTMRDPHAALKVEQVRGIFETVARERSVVVPGRINPRSVHYEVMGLRGRQLERKTIKFAAVQTVKALYSENLLALGFDTGEKELKKHQDIVDAILVGRLALSRLQDSERAGVEPHEVFRGTTSARSRGSWV